MSSPHSDVQDDAAAYVLGTLDPDECRAVSLRRHPIEVSAIFVNSGAGPTKDIDESTAAVLRFDGGRVASFVTSFNASDVASYRIVGTKGHMRLDPAYEYTEPLSATSTVGADARPHAKQGGGAPAVGKGSS